MKLASTRIGWSLIFVLGLSAPAASARAAEDSLAAFQRAAELAPQDPQAQFNLGVMSLKAGDYARAARALKKATDLNGEDAEAWEALGTADLKLRRIADAMAALKRSTTLNPSRPRAWGAYAQALVADSSGASLDKALDAYAQAARLLPNDFRPALNRGLLLAKLGRDVEAIDVLQKVERKPGGQAATRVLCVLYNKTQNYAEAEEVCRQASESDTTAESFYNLGFALQSRKRPADARGAYAQALGVDPQNAPALYALAFLDFQAGNADAALRGFEAAIKARQGDFPEAEYNAAVLLGDQGRYEEAADLYRTLLGVHPQDEDAQANLKNVMDLGLSSLLERGKDAYERGDLEAARDAWERARRLDPASGEAVRMLKLVRTHDDAASVSVAAARKAARVEVAQRLASDDAAVKRRGLKALDAQKYTEAARLLAFYLRNHPKDAAVRKALTQAHAAMGAVAPKKGPVQPADQKIDPQAVRKLYFDGVEHYLAGDLPAAMVNWRQVLSLQPDHLDAQRSLARAELELQALKRLGKGE